MSMLSSNNILFEVQQQVCDILNNDPSLSSIGFLPENKKQIDFEIEKALKQQGLAAIVMTPSARFQGQYSDNQLVWELPDLTIQIVENVPVNRATSSKSSMTGQDAAIRVLDILGKDHYGQFSPIDYSQGEDSGLLVNKAVFKCLVLRYEEQPIVIIPEPVCFTALQAGSTIALSKQGAAPDVSLEKSTDGENFIAWDNLTITLSNADDKVYIRATDSGNQRFSNSRLTYNYFTMTGKIAVTGNIMSLLDNTCQTTSLSGRDYCFNYLFKNCSAMTKAPMLSARELASYCYNYMFYNCTSLSTAPDLPAEELKTYCYSNMFNGCSSLDSLKTYQEDWLAGNTTLNWLNNTKQNGNFYCKSSLPLTRGVSNIPNGWNITTF